MLHARDGLKQFELFQFFIAKIADQRGGRFQESDEEQQQMSGKPLVLCKATRPAASEFGPAVPACSLFLEHLRRIEYAPEKDSRERRSRRDLGQVVCGWSATCRCLFDSSFNLKY